MTEDQGQQVIAQLAKLEALQREAAERQSRVVWVALPIFAVLCVQTVLLLVR